MKFVGQRMEEVLAALGPLEADWMDETAARVVQKLLEFPAQRQYSPADVRALLDEDFDDALLIIRLFLGLSKDQFLAHFRAIRTEGPRVTTYRNDPERFVEALIELGVLGAMEAEVNKVGHWSDALVERLRSGRGSAITGQRRGRGVEDFVQRIVGGVFGDRFDARCTFQGPRGNAKCDFAIPSRKEPCILIEAKGYAATGSKMTDIIGDIEKIISVKRGDTSLLFFTDGLSWHERRSDLRKIVEYQNRGDITRIYTKAHAVQFEADLRQLQAEYGL